MPTIQASEPASELGTPPVSAKVRAAFAVSVTGEASAIGCSQSGMLETGTKTELAKTSGNSSTNPAVCAVSAPAYDQRYEGEDPAEGEPEGGDEGDARERRDDAGLETEADQVADADHQADDQDVSHEVGGRSPEQDRRAGHRHRAEAVDHAAAQVLGEADRSVGRTEGHRLDEDPRQQVVDVADSRRQRQADRTAEDVDEEDDEHDRLDRREDQQVGLAPEVAEVPHRHDGGVDHARLGSSQRRCMRRACAGEDAPRPSRRARQLRSAVRRSRSAPDRSAAGRRRRASAAAGPCR